MWSCRIMLRIRKNPVNSYQKDHNWNSSRMSFLPSNCSQTLFYFNNKNKNKISCSATKVYLIITIVLLGNELEQLFHGTVGDG